MAEELDECQSLQEKKNDSFVNLLKILIKVFWIFLFGNVPVCLVIPSQSFLCYYFNTFLKPEAPAIDIFFKSIFLLN